MIGNFIKVSPVLGLLFTAVACADTGPDLVPIGVYDGLTFGQTPQEVDGLTTAGWMQSSCSLERFYYLAEVDRRNFLADVRLVWPGLLYRFFDNRLYAIQAEFPPGGGAFARLQTYLTRTYGKPNMSASWQGAPSDTYVYQHRLRSAGWYGPDSKRSIWLTSDDEGGSIIMIDNVMADLGMQQTDERCSMDRTDIVASAANPPTGSLAKE